MQHWQGGVGAPLLERREAGGMGLLLLAHVPMGEEDTGKDVVEERKRREGKTREQRRAVTAGRREGGGNPEGFPASSAFLEASCQPPALGTACAHFA